MKSGIKILGFVGSMRKDKNTYLVVKSCMDAAREASKSVETEIVYIADLDVGPCRACYEKCSRSPYKCVVRDGLQETFRKMVEVDALVFGSPKYFPMPSKMIAFMERLVCLSYFTEVRHPDVKHPLDDKPCGLIAVSGGGLSPFGFGRRFPHK